MVLNIKIKEQQALSSIKTSGTHTFLQGIYMPLDEGKEKGQKKIDNTILTFKESGGGWGDPFSNCVL